MGEHADYLMECHGYPDEDGCPMPEDYLDMTDDELRNATAVCRNEKIKSIRKYQFTLSEKQRYCLAAWIAENDAKYIH